MPIKYCDYITGDDDTGDGSAGNPYKTIDKASTGLSGGDEVRVAKSPAPTALTGTLGFTAGSTAVTGVDTLFTSELVIGDFVKGGDGQYYEVITITDNTNAVLYKKYPSATGAGVSSFKLGVTSTGEAAAATTQVQEVEASGSSGNRLKVSGGWDLTGPTQDGQTYFRQMHSTFANRYGYGLYIYIKSWIEVERLHFLRYDMGIYLYNSAQNNILTSPNCSSCGGEGIKINITCSFNTVTSPICNSNNDYGIYLASNAEANTITSPICNSNGKAGIRIYGVQANTITSPTCNYNADGIEFYTNANNNLITSPTCNNNSDDAFAFTRAHNNIIVSPTCNNNGDDGLYLTSSLNNIVLNYSGTGNADDVTIASPPKLLSENPCLKIQHLNAAGDNRCYYEGGVTYRDTADARSTQCLKYDPKSAILYISQSFFFKADSGVEQTLSAYIKDDADFNGDIQAAIYFNGVKITGWTAWTPTTSYVQKTIVAASGDITEDGVLELRIKVRGTAGNVFVDDLAAS